MTKILKTVRDADMVILQTNNRKPYTNLYSPSIGIILEMTLTETSKVIATF